MTTTNRRLAKATLALEESGNARIAGNDDLADYYLSVAHVQAAIAAVEEQRTANLIAAYNGDLLKNPYETGTHENNEWWAKTAGDITEKLGVQA